MKLRNNFYSIEFCEKSGKILSYKSKSTEYLSRYGDKPLITIKLMDDNGFRQEINSDFAADVTIENNGQLQMSFDRVGNYDIAAVATVAYDDSGFIRWKLSISNNSGYMIECINYPGMLLDSKLPTHGQDYKLFLPIFEGVEITDYSFRDRNAKFFEIDYPSKGWEGVYPGAVALQFMAYYNDREGLYIGMHDKHFNTKSIDAQQKWNGIELTNKLFPGMEEHDYNYEFDIVTGIFGGGFYDACDIYRDFVESSDLISQPKLKDNKLISKWVQDSPIVVIYPVRGEKDTGDVAPNMYYPYTNALPYIDKLKQKLDSKLLVMLCHWEGSAPWCPPYVWPPYGDLDNFQKFISQLHAEDNLLGLYCSGIAWTEKSIYTDYNMEGTFTEDELKQVMCVSPRQDLPYCIICNDYIRWGYDMCPSSSVTKQIIAEEVNKIIGGCEVDYIQLFDQNLGGNASLCYSASHGHPRTPGKWQQAAMRDVIDSAYSPIQESNRNIMLGCEAAASEGFSDKLLFNDARNYQGFGVGTPVPAYNYIFHEYVNNFMGNQNTTYVYLNAEENPENIFYRTAHLFAQGDLLTIVLKNDGKANWDWGTPWDTVDVNQEAYFQMLKLMNDWRKNNLREELIYGRMIKPLEVKCSKYSILHKTGKQISYPSIIRTMWRTTHGESLLLINPLAIAQEFTVIFDQDCDVVVYDSPCGIGQKRTMKQGENTIKMSGYSVLKLTTKEVT